MPDRSLSDLVTTEAQDSWSDHHRTKGSAKMEKLIMLRDGRWILQVDGEFSELSPDQAQAWLASRGITPNY